MSQKTLNHNAVTLAILARDLGTRNAQVARTIERGGQALIDSLGAFLPVEAIAGMSKTAVTRVVQAVSFAVSGAVEDFNKSTAYLVSLVLLTGQQRVSFADALHVMGASGEGTAPVNGVSRAKLQRHLQGRAGTLGTMVSQCSRTVGKSGFLTALGVTVKGDAHGFTLTEKARSLPFMLAYGYALQNMTEGALALVQGDDE